MAPHAEDAVLSPTTSLPVKDTYRGPRHGLEYHRLRTQHDLVLHQENGKLIQSPLDLSRSTPPLRILDSATGDGQWIVEVAEKVPATAELVGADIAPQHFLPAASLPKNLSLITQSIFSSWPAEFKGSFDLSHQRFVLAVASDAGAQEAVGHLYETVKPGGWIELHEGDMETILEGPEYPAMMKFRDVMVKAWKGLGHQPSPGPTLEAKLKAVGAVDIASKVQNLKAGPMAEDKVQGERAVLTLLGLLDSIRMFVGSQPGFWFSGAQFDELRADLENELRTVGNSWNFHIAWGRKAE
ncbi:S-adenosyl-L-methionine-dependent methyltransferase [Lophium mytilinum]|uniref:S-adenosyl-L-methionine-dependent methyltransferase n=1 Tax=Lophium mytilinum TaxID=390894 RepID=A0A6A6RD45_9PEZI|nr:S-adenosyl-L-methionine-dependent methyltransferase [Lophium mytilinum]